MFKDERGFGFEDGVEAIARKSMYFTVAVIMRYEINVIPTMKRNCLPRSLCFTASEIRELSDRKLLVISNVNDQWLPGGCTAVGVPEAVTEYDGVSFTYLDLD